MSKSARRVIGIIRIQETTEPGVKHPSLRDDSTLESLLAGLAGEPPSEAAGQRRFGLQIAAAPRGCHRFRRVAGNLHRLRAELEREYVALAAG